MATVEGWDSAAQKNLWADACRESLWTFTKEAWGLEHWPQKRGQHPLLTERIHKPICDWFERHAKEWLENRSRKNLMCLVPRFFGKTTFITKAANAWLHLQDPELSTYIGSENIARSMEFLEGITKVIDGSDPYSRFAHLYGVWYDKDRTWKREGVVHAARTGLARTDFSFGTWAVERGITGHHPDVGFLDDPTSYESIGAHSQWFRIVNDHVASLLPIFADNCLMVFVGTRYGDDDHFGKELREEGVATWEGMPPPFTEVEGRQLIRDTGKWHVYFLAARDAEGVPTFPERCGDDFLKEFQRKSSLRYFAQMMNDPSGSELTPLTREQIDMCWVDLAGVPKQLRVVITMDTAFKSETRIAQGDESVMQVWGLARDGTGDAYYLEGYSSNVWKAEEFLEKLVALIQKYQRGGWRISYLIDEKEPGGKAGTWELVVKSKCNEKGISMPAFIRLNRTKALKNKEERTRSAATYWVEGYVKLLRNAPGVYKLTEQMLKIGMGGRDDWRDAAADVFNEAIYYPRGRKGLKELLDPVPYRIGDELLKPNRLSNVDATKAYDEFHKVREVGYEPV